MAYEEILRSVSFNADSSLALYTGVPNLPGSASPNYGKQYRVVKFTGNDQVGAAVLADIAVVVGVLQNKPQVTGQAATVGVQGISMVMAGGAFVAGDKLTVDSAGRAVKVATGTDPFFALAVKGASGADELAPALLRCN